MTGCLRYGGVLSATGASNTPALMDACSYLGGALASSPKHASSFSGCTLCRHSSEIRTGCANERSSGSEEGVVSNHDPYSARQHRTIHLLTAPQLMLPTLSFTFSGLRQLIS